MTLVNDVQVYSFRGFKRLLMELLAASGEPPGSARNRIRTALAGATCSNNVFGETGRCFTVLFDKHFKFK